MNDYFRQCLTLTANTMEKTRMTTKDYLDQNLFLAFNDDDFILDNPDLHDKFLAGDYENCSEDEMKRILRIYRECKRNGVRTEKTYGPIRPDWIVKNRSFRIRYACQQKKNGEKHGGFMVAQICAGEKVFTVKTAFCSPKDQYNRAMESAVIENTMTHWLPFRLNRINYNDFKALLRMIFSGNAPRWVRGRAFAPVGATRVMLNGWFKREMTAIENILKKEHNEND
jgi:hypothetical protein